MNTVLSKDNCISKYTWGNNCTGWNFVDTDQLSVKQELMPVGTAEHLHFHNHSNQFFFILRGSASFEIDGQSIIVANQQGIEIKPGQKHRISNMGTTDLEFILYSQPSTKNDRINC